MSDAAKKDTPEQAEFRAQVALIDPDLELTF